MNRASRALTETRVLEVTAAMHDAVREAMADGVSAEVVLKSVATQLHMCAAGLRTKLTRRQVLNEVAVVEAAATVLAKIRKVSG